MAKNQCQGCQTGWELEKHNPWPKGSPPMYFHIVEDGYKGERIVCTQNKYKQGRQEQC
jgi:hypothetical protein